VHLKFMGIDRSIMLFGLRSPKLKVLNMSNCKIWTTCDQLLQILLNLPLLEELIIDDSCAEAFTSPGSIPPQLDGPAFTSRVVHLHHRKLSLRNNLRLIASLFPFLSIPATAEIGLEGHRCHPVVPYYHARDIFAILAKAVDAHCDKANKGHGGGPFKVIEFGPGHNDRQIGYNYLYLLLSAGGHRCGRVMVSLQFPLENIPDLGFYPPFIFLTYAPRLCAGIGAVVLRMPRHDNEDIGKCMMPSFKTAINKSALALCLPLLTNAQRVLVTASAADYFISALQSDPSTVLPGLKELFFWNWCFSDDPGPSCMDVVTRSICHFAKKNTFKYIGFKDCHASRAQMKEMHRHFTRSRVSIESSNTRKGHGTEEEEEEEEEEDDSDEDDSDDEEGEEDGEVVKE